MNKETLTFNKKSVSWGVLLVSILLIMSSVLAETWTFSDSGLSGSSSGTFLDFNNKALQVNNATVSNNISVDGVLLNGSYVGYGELIQSSDGYCYPFNASGFTSAYDENTSLTLPKGVVTLTSDIALRNHTVIRGQGMNNTIIKFSSGVTNGFEAVTGDGSTVYRHNITFEDLTIDAQQNAEECIYLNRCWDITLKNVRLNGSTIYLMYTEYYNGRIHLDNVWGTGLNNPSGDSFHAFGLSEIRDSTIEHLYMDDLTDNVNTLNVGHGKNVTINDVRSYDTGNDGIKIGGTVADPARHIHCSNIYVDGVKDAVGNEDAFSFYTAGKVHDLTVDGLTSLEGTVYINDVYGGSFSHFNITNTLDDTSSEVIGHGLVVITCSNVDFSLGDIWDVEKSGIYVDSSDNITFSQVDTNLCDYRNAMDSSEYVDFDTCTFSESGNDAWQITSSDHFDFINCDFIQNTYKGIDTRDGACTYYNIFLCNFNNNGDNYAVDMHDDDDYVRILHCTGENGNEYVDNNAATYNISGLWGMTVN